MFLCQHHTRDLVWRPDLLRHANGAKRLIELVGVATDLDEIGSVYQKIFGAGGRGKHAGRELRVETHNMLFRFLDPGLFAERYSCARPDAAKPYIAGMSVAVASLEAARGILAQNGVPHREQEGGLLVPPEHACGAFLLFREVSE
jgi:hypothetical protein